MSASIIALSLRFLVMAVATFLSIIIWSRKRDAAWMLIVVGVLAGYGDILYSLLIEFGIVPELGQAPGLVGLLAYIIPNLPWLFFSAAFISIIIQRRPRS